jgi:hypothetical protein
MDLIDLMPPGLYEAVITEVDKDTAKPGADRRSLSVRLEPRTLDDIRKIVANNPEDDRRFVTAARVSEINLASVSDPGRADGSRPGHERKRASAPEDAPQSASVRHVLERESGDAHVRGAGRQDAAGTPAGGARQSLLAMERTMSSWISTSLNLFGGIRDAMVEKAFLENLWITAAAGDGWSQAIGDHGRCDASNAGSGPRGG